MQAVETFSMPEPHGFFRYVVWPINVRFARNLRNALG